MWGFIFFDVADLVLLEITSNSIAIRAPIYGSFVIGEGGWMRCFLFNPLVFNFKLINCELSSP